MSYHHYLERRAVRATVFKSPYLFGKTHKYTLSCPAEMYGKHVEEWSRSWHSPAQEPVFSARAVRWCSVQMSASSRTTPVEKKTWVNSRHCWITAQLSHCVVRQQLKDFVFALDRGRESILKFQTENTCQTHTQTFYTHAHTYTFPRFRTCSTQIQRFWGFFFTL